MASSVPVLDLGKKRKHEESSSDALSKHSDCESDSDSDFACEAPDGGNTCSTVSGKRLQSGIQPFTYLKSSSVAYVSSTKETTNDRVVQNSLASNHAPVCSNSVPAASDEAASDSDGEEAAQVAEVEPTIRSASVTLSSDTNRSVTKPAPLPGLMSSLQTNFSAAKVPYPLYSARLVNANNDLAHMRNLGSESNMQQNSTSKYPPFHSLYTFTSQISRHFNPTSSPPRPPLPPPPPPIPPPPVRTQPPPPFNFFMPSPSSFPPFRPFFPPYLTLPPPLPHPPFPPPPHLNTMTYPSPPSR